MTTQARPIETVIVQPGVSREASGRRPTETRYGWCPFNDINLIGPSGTPTLFVQPYRIEVNGALLPNPHFGVLPKGRLIPFPTFLKSESTPSPELTDSNGRAVLIEGQQTITALEAIGSVLSYYGWWGFTMLNSLQGLDQEQATRIFKVVQPFEYLLADLEGELSFGALERIAATETLEFEGVDGYTVAPLENDLERDIAHKLVEEMTGGASTAYVLATTILDETEASMTQKFAGGMGKSTPDPLDIRLSAELRRELPRLIGGDPKQNDIAELKSQVGYLVDREASRADKERIKELEEKVRRLEAGEEVPAEPARPEPAKVFGIGDTVVAGGREGKVVAKMFGKYKVAYADETAKVFKPEEINP